ncbi:MAG: SPL family radical SAM protein, partial [Nitrosotalea sp.]
VLEKAKSIGLNTGVIVAPVFPSVKIRPDPFGDMRDMIHALAKIKPDHIFGECLHLRGSNMKEIEIALGERPIISGFDGEAQREFYKLLKLFGLRGIWWPDH